MSERMMGAAAVAVAAVLVLAGAAGAQTHAPWPADWNNWNDPALWCTVSDPGNAGEWSGASYDGQGPNRICGAVSYNYRIAKFEVTAGQYTAFLNAVATTDTYGLYDPYMADTRYFSPYWIAGCNIQRSGSAGHYTYSVAADWANRPVNYVSWGDAVRFANWLTNGRPTGTQTTQTTEDGSYVLSGATSDTALMAVTRKPNAKYVIPSEDEWYKAAYYKGGGTNAGYWDFATGSNVPPNNDVANPDPGNTANWNPDNSDMSIGSPYYRTEVGEFENSSSSYGTFDQTGNIQEWNEDNLANLLRVTRGGAFGSYTLSAAYRSIEIPIEDFEYLGFRVAEVPEPASMALLALGGLAVLRKRRSAPMRRG